MAITKCYNCNLPITDPKNHVKLEAELKTKKGVWRWRNFHKINDNGVECHKKYFENVDDKEARKIEDDEMVELYEWIRKELLNQTEPLSNYFVRRLMGAYNDTFIAKGINTKGQTDKGYSYNLILRVFKSQKSRIQQHIANTYFEDENHKINAIMLYVWPRQLPQAKRQLEEKERRKKQMERRFKIEDVSDLSLDKYVKKEKPKEVEDSFFDDL